MKDPVDEAPYRRLWAAVVYQAIRDMESFSERRLAMDWIHSKSTKPQSMRWICDMLDLDYYKLLSLSMTREGRSRILRWEERGDKVKRSPRSMK